MYRSFEHAYLASVAPARVEGTSRVVSGHVPAATHHIVDVLTKGGSVGAVPAGTDTKLVVSHEILHKTRQ